MNKYIFHTYNDTFFVYGSNVAEAYSEWSNQHDETVHLILEQESDCCKRVWDCRGVRYYVNVYSVSRHFGGHEEGGWWYGSRSLRHGA